MCGIIGINENNSDLTKKAGALFGYRGPDDHSYYSNNDLTFGHHRLSIIDTDSRSNQPLWDNDHTVCIIFNGEIYNYKDIKEQLAQKYIFNTTSDTEVLIYAYKEWGIEMSRHIQGMFAFALYDTQAQKVLLMRDHAGIKPLYYYAENGIFAFASEVKGVINMLKQKNIPLEINKQAIDLYTAFGYIPSPYSLYKNIFKLPKSSYLEYDLKNKKIVSENRYTSPYTPVKTEEEFVRLLEKKVLDHLIADVPVGVFFSGGTDSSLITSILHKHTINLETFSIGIDYKSDDKEYFNKISNYLNLKSHVYNFDVQEFDAIYEEVLSKTDEPTSDNSIFPTYFVSKKAAEKVKVVLSGEGGDEYFYGYQRSLILYTLRNKRDYGITLLDKLFFLLPAFKSKNHIFQKLFVIFKQPFSFYLLQMSPARDNATLAQWRLAKEEFKKRSVTPLTLDQEFYLEDDLLRKTDFATSYVSIEGRVPLLDIDIIKNAENFENQKLENNVLKAFLKKILTRYLPQEMVYRNKSGFGINLTTLFTKSQFLRPDFDKALKYLKEQGIYTKQPKDIDMFIHKYPNFCFSLISLYRALYNNQL